MKEENGKLILDFTDYVVKGILYLTDWYNHDGYIEMKPYHIEEPSTEQIVWNSNDSGFGAQSFNAVEVDIYKNYEGTLVHYQSVKIEPDAYKEIMARKPKK